MLQSTVQNKKLDLGDQFSSKEKTKRNLIAPAYNFDAIID